MAIQHSIIPVILAGGLGTRIKSVIDSQQRPKPLLEVNNRPFITYILDQLVDFGFNKVIISTGHMANKWMDIIGNNYQTLSISYVQEFKPLGTGGAIKEIINSVKDLPTHIMVINGDTYIQNINYSEIIISLYDYMITGIIANGESRYGNISVNQNNLVSSFKEKENNIGSKFINAGIYVFSVNSLIQQMENMSDSFSLENDLLPSLCNNNDVLFYELTGSKFIDIGTKDSYEYFRNLICK